MFVGGGKLRARLRQWKHRLLYQLSLAQRAKLEKLQASVEAAFCSPWVSHVEVQLQPNAGKDTSAKQWIYWDAPVTVSVFRRTKRGNKVALCMALYAVDGDLCIVQLQGVNATDIPLAMRGWPRLFVEACQAFAVEQAFRRVRVAKAATLPSFRNATVRADTAEAMAAARLAIQSRMQGHYDGTARDLGFVETSRWFDWNVRESRS